VEAVQLGVVGDVDDRRDPGGVDDLQQPPEEPGGADPAAEDRDP